MTKGNRMNVNERDWNNVCQRKTSSTVICTVAMVTKAEKKDEEENEAVLKIDIDFNSGDNWFFKWYLFFRCTKEHLLCILVSISS